MDKLLLTPIAHIQTDFNEKFGIPRQSRLVAGLKGKIVFAPEYRQPQALRGLADFSHLWLIWGFTKAFGRPFSPTVRPPRLGGNEKMGVFATRSPFRPNPIGLSCVELESIEQTLNGPVLTVRGADLLNGTPIYDIKPYIPYADSVPSALSGFTAQNNAYTLQVNLPPQLKQAVPPEKLQGLLGVLAQDPRPPYQQDPNRVYGLSFANLEVHFKVRGTELTVIDITKTGKAE